MWAPSAGTIRPAKSITLPGPASKQFCDPAATQTWQGNYSKPIVLSQNGEAAMADETFKREDVVRRKSDGQKMFVHTTGKWKTGDLYIECIWYEADREHRERYASTAIEPWPDQ
jgi:uncharacterized protein YodC (DUF2158 family)